MTQGHPQVSSRELEAHAAQRTWVAFLGSQVVATAVILLPLIPAVQTALRVTVSQMAIAIVPFIVFQVLCLGEFKRAGVSPLYQRLELAESIISMAIGPGLLLFAGDGQSIFWTFYVASAIQAASVQTRAHAIAVIVIPLATGLGLWLVHGDVPGLVASLLVTAVALYVFSTYRPVFGRIASLLDAERELRAQIVAERARAERQRMARDLHDGLGADLTALVWQARDLEKRVRGEAHRRQVDGIIGALRGALHELRRTVVRLRSAS